MHTPQLRSLRHALSAVAIAATALLCTSQALAYSNVFIFGDSLSDSGNNGIVAGFPTGVPQTITSDFYIPSLPYTPAGTYSNGPVWATSFASGLGLSAAPSLAGGTNFAFGGARVAVNGNDTPALPGFPFSLNAQVGQFLGATGGVAPSSSLYVIAGGGNDARAALTSLGPAPTLPQIISTISLASSQFATNVGNLVDTLQAAGAQHIVVWNAPNLGAAPAVAGQGLSAVFLGTALASSMNDALNYRLSFETGVTTFDLFGLVGQVVANPGFYGLSNVTNACVTGVCMNPSSYLFWDGIHPTAAGHELIATAMLAAPLPIPEPATILLMAFGVAGLLAWRRRAVD
jgi:outer membrane lipase/esterase